MSAYEAKQTKRKSELGWQLNDEATLNARILNKIDENQT